MDETKEPEFSTCIIFEQGSVCMHASYTLHAMNQENPDCKPCSIKYIDSNVSVQDSMRYPYDKDNL
jgi:hypothetical protein